MALDLLDKTLLLSSPNRLFPSSDSSVVIPANRGNLALGRLLPVLSAVLVDPRLLCRSEVGVFLGSVVLVGLKPLDLVNVCLVRHAG